VFLAELSPLGLGLWGFELVGQCVGVRETVICLRLILRLGLAAEERIERGVTVRYRGRGVLLCGIGMTVSCVVFVWRLSRDSMARRAASHPA